MRRTLSSLCVLTIVCFFRFSFAHILPGSLVPKGGETLKAGDAVTMKWVQQYDHQGKYDVFFSPDGGANWETITEGLRGGDGSNVTVTYDWTVPDQPTTEAKIKVIQNNGGANYDIISEVFTIVGANGIAYPMDRGLSVNGAVIDFNSATGVFQVRYTGDESPDISFDVFDVEGRLVVRLVSERSGRGVYTKSFSVRSLNRTSGFYLARLRLGRRVFAAKWISLGR